MARTKGIQYFLQECDGEWVSDFDFRTRDYATTKNLGNARPFSPGEYAVIHEYIQAFTTLTAHVVGFRYTKERHSTKVCIPRR